MIFKRFLCLALFFFAFQLNAQTPIEDLNFYSDVIANAHNPKHKFRANKLFQSKFEKFISNPDAIDQLDQLKYVVVKKSEDQSLAVVTWQLLNDNSSDYFGYVLKEGKAFKLEQRSDVLEDNLYTEISPKEWYGALYYNIKEVTIKGKKHYLLFGYNAYNNGNHVKVVDVLSFENDSLVLGAEIFRKKKQGTRDQVTMRLVTPYAEGASVKLNYDDKLGMIIGDHIVRRNTPQGDMFLPDGSYIGYKWNAKEGQYDYIDKVFNQVSDTPPTERMKKRRRKGKEIYKSKSK